MTASTAAENTLLHLKALADPKRLGIVAKLAGGERCVCDLQEALGAGQSLLSFHLRALREAGLVCDRRDGRWVYYSLNREALGALEVFFADLGAAEGPRPANARSCNNHDAVDAKERAT